MDLKFIRDFPERAQEIVRRRRESVDILRILACDERRRELIRKRDERRRELNLLSERIGERIAKGEDATEEKENARRLSETIRELEGEIVNLEKEIASLLALCPNVILPDVGDEERIVKEWGEKPHFDFTPLPHYEIGERLGILDLRTASKIAGSRFILFRGKGAILERALINFCLDYHTKRHNYTEISLPYLNREECFFAAGDLPKLADDMYKIEGEPFYLIPTAEVPLVNLHRDSVLKEEELPKYYCAYSACFRREAGSYGQKIRGIIRVHQFDKVELVKFTKPEESEKELEMMVRDAEDILQELNLPYRIKLLSAWDMAFQSAKTYDIEVWASGVGEYLEVSSLSNCTDFQAKRSKTRLRRKDGRLEYVHILNGSGLAFPRLFIALVENYQRKDGKIVIPPPLQPYTGFDLIE
jgi:seryl-tRNA synthetase|uniref:Serine--tRNA ligase n=1 Tax=candidate division WOR-3 bacterium TaxID=2052148 RepID=A0A7C3UNC3_UNCW3